MKASSKQIGVAMVLLGLHLSAACDVRNPDPPPLVHQIPGGKSEVHANAYVIEGREVLVLVDSLLTVDGGERVRAKIRELEKPLAGVVLTHGHPDHYGGLTPAVDGLQVRVYAARGVDDVIRRDDARKGEALAELGIAWPQRRTFPTDIVTDGATLTFRDISLILHEIGPAESDFDTIWLLDTDDDPVAFVGDLLAVDEHAYVADGHTASWIRAVDRLRTILPDEVEILPGHGDTVAMEDFTWIAAYLQRYREEVSRLAGDAARLTDAQKEEVRRVMTSFVGNDRNARWAEEGADAVAEELLNAR